MTSDDEQLVRDWLQGAAEQMGVVALGVAVVMPDGQTTFATIVSMDSTTPEHALFGKLSDELYKCAEHAATAAKLGSS